MKEEMNTKVSGEEQVAATTAKEMNSIPTNAMFVVFEVFYTSIAGREYRSKYVFNELADAKKYVQERLDEYLVWTAEYHCIDLNDQDDYDDFYECLETTNDDEEMIYGLYPFDGDKNSLEYHIMEVKMFNEAERCQGLWC